MKILVKDGDSKKWNLAEPITAKLESELQHLLLDSPSVIPVDEIRESTSPLMVAVGEFGLPGSGSTDALAFTSDGDVAIIECKLASNPESKRKVIGQILEYAAYLWGMSYEQVDEGVKKRRGKPLSELMKVAVASEWDEPSFQDGISETLRNGAFILIVVVDELNDELRRIIRYVNECSTSGYSLHALEVRRFRNKGVDMLVPHLYGASIKRSSAAINKRWTESSFFERIESLEKKVSATARDIFDWSRDKADRVLFGAGRETGSFSFHYLKNGSTVSVFSVYTNGELMLSYGWLLPRLGLELLKELHQKIAAIPTFNNIPEDFSKWHYITLEEAFPSKKEIDDFKRVVEWLRERISE